MSHTRWPSGSSHAGNNLLSKDKVGEEASLCLRDAVQTVGAQQPWSLLAQYEQWSHPAETVLVDHDQSRSVTMLQLFSQRIFQ
jgi:hypothetical protein